MNDSKELGSNFISTLSHQLKAPVATIQSLLKTITDGFTGETNVQTLQFVEKAIKKASEANRLISDLLHFQSYADARHIKKEDFDLNALVQSVAASYVSEASDKDVSLSVRTPENIEIIVSANIKGIEIVLRNLIDNALKYTPPNGQILVKLAAVGKTGKCTLQVTDTGSGIPAEEIGSIFNPFFRSIKSKSAVPGTGLGLAIAKTIIEGHGGAISVSSEENKGSAFKAVLPYKTIRTKKRAIVVRKKVLIIGGVTAGPKAAARIRRLDESADVTIIERSEFLSYSGCGLPSYIAGRVRSPKALMSTADNTIRDINFFESIKNITILNKTEAMDIDRKRKVVKVKDLAAGKTRDVPYDVLVLATGAASSVPDIPGISGAGIYSLHRMEDAEAIKTECSNRNARDIYIIGGGLIGIETAESLIAAGARVTILEKEPAILSNLFDADFAAKIRNSLNKKGIKVVTDVSIKKITRAANQLVFSTDKGKFLADLVILSTGVRPNSRLAHKAGLALSPIGAVKVNKYLQTSDRSIYAIGDCAESTNFLTGRHEYWPLGSISTKMGRIAADNICGRPSEFSGFIGTTMFQNFDIAIARTGLTLSSARRSGFSPESMVITGLDRAHYSKNAELVTLKIIADAKTRVILGAQAFGRGDVVRQIQIFAGAITRKLTLSDLFALDLGYAPVFNNPIDLSQTACCVLLSKIEGLIRTMTIDQFNKEIGGLHVIDVSPVSERIFTTIPGSINAPLENLRREGVPFDKKDKCVLYSKTSSRAYEAYRYLVSRGYSNISFLEGGYAYWAE
jgi:NADPH-dependent 2,4-dienoyl-CoA reductase/sulfur reductase-like enzyme/rhodanese-related sulfurtransferase